MPDPLYLTRPAVDPRDGDRRVDLPYGMTTDGIIAAVGDLHAYFHALNEASVRHGYERLEDIILAASFSGLASELFVRAVSRESSAAIPGLTRNLRIGGRPDLIPRAMYPGDAVLQGSEGVEVKASTSKTSWQGHNPESGWLMILRIAVDRETQPVYDRRPTSVEEILIARLEEADWNYSGRGAGSRRTPTASINRDGRKKLRRSVVYQRGRAPAAAG